MSSWSRSRSRGGSGFEVGWGYKTETTRTETTETRTAETDNRIMIPCGWLMPVIFFSW